MQWKANLAPTVAPSPAKRRRSGSAPGAAATNASAYGSSKSRSGRRLSAARTAATPIAVLPTPVGTWSSATTPAYGRPMDELSRLFRRAADEAARYRPSLPDRPVVTGAARAGVRAAFDGPLPATPTPPAQA